MTHHLRHDCSHSCETCDMADPALCQDFALMSADEPETIRFCKHCNEQAWHDEHTFTDGDGNQFTTSVWACPKCGRVFG